MIVKVVDHLDITGDDESVNVFLAQSETRFKVDRIVNDKVYVQKVKNRAT